MKKILLSTMALAAVMTAGAANLQASRAAEVQQTATQAAKSSVTYKGKLNINVYGMDLDPTDATIIVNEETDGTYTFILKDFAVAIGDMTMNIGDATIANLQPTTEDGTVVLKATNQDAPVTGGDLGESLKDGKVVVTMEATIKDHVLTANLSNITVTLVAEGEDDSVIDVVASFKSDSYTINTDEPSDTPTQLAGFNGDWETCIPWDSKGNTKESGTQPKGWHISNVYTAVGAVEVGSKVDGKETGEKAVKLENMEKASQSIPGYLTLGTPWATAEVQSIPTKVRNADGGTFGGIQFTGRPTAIKFDYKRDNSKGTENATVVAYLWKGTCTQADVPGNTAVELFGYGKATKVTMTNRDRNILGMKTTLGGALTDNSTLIASVEKSISDNNASEWKTMEIKFDYKTDDTPEYLNIIFAANDYFGDRTKIVAGNSLTIANVRLVYGATGINGVTDNTSTNAAEAIYDLSGRRIPTMQKGLNIVRGKDGKFVKVMK